MKYSLQWDGFGDVYNFRIKWLAKKKHYIPTGNEYEDYLKSDRKFRPMAMQCLAAGALKPDVAMEYVTRFPKIESVLFGASSKAHIQQTKDLIEKGFARW